MSNNFVILIPARGGSQRISNKNIKSFANSSLLEIKLNQAKRVLGDLGDIMLNTDSKEYLEKYSDLYDKGVLRPKIYGSSEIPMNDVYEYFADSLKKEHDKLEDFADSLKKQHDKLEDLFVDGDTTLTDTMDTEGIAPPPCNINGNEYLFIIEFKNARVICLNSLFSPETIGISIISIVVFTFILYKFVLT